jgi:hypothetical protein
MQTQELKAIYKEACDAQRQEPEPAVFKMWKHVLCDCDERDVRGALTEWWRSERGRFLPKPSELRPEADRLARLRQRAESPEFCTESTLGWLLKVVDGKNTKVRCECSECALARAAQLRRKGTGDAKGVGGSKCLGQSQT